MAYSCSRGLYPSGVAATVRPWRTCSFFLIAASSRSAAFFFASIRFASWATDGVASALPPALPLALSLFELLSLELLSLAAVAFELPQAEPFLVDWRQSEVIRAIHATRGD